MWRAVLCYPALRFPAALREITLWNRFLDRLSTRPGEVEEFCVRPLFPHGALLERLAVILSSVENTTPHDDAPRLAAVFRHTDKSI